MIGWKQAYTTDLCNIVLVKLEIPEDAKVKHVERYGETKDFYRCDKAKVLSITSVDGKHRVKRARSMKDTLFTYEVGKEVYAKKDPTYGREFGIHFFTEKQKAIDYIF